MWCAIFHTGTISKASRQRQPLAVNLGEDDDEDAYNRWRHQRDLLRRRHAVAPHTACWNCPAASGTPSKNTSAPARKATTPSPSPSPCCKTAVATKGASKKASKGASKGKGKGAERGELWWVWPRCGRPRVRHCCRLPRSRTAARVWVGTNGAYLADEHEHSPDFEDGEAHTAMPPRPPSLAPTTTV